MRNNSVLFKIVAFVFVISSITSCYKDDISDLDTRIEGIESDTISSIKSQISMINASIDNLKITDQDVKNLISALQNTAAEMQRSLNYTNEKLDSSNISNVNLIGELKIYTDNKLSEINLFIQYLQAKDDSLTENISSLQKYVDNAIYDTRFWAETTFTTLEQYDSVTNSIAGIKVAIASIENAISELEGRVNAKIESDINAAVIGMNASLKDSVISITQAYKNAISDANKAITAAYNDAIAKSIAKSEDSMKDWVNSQLSGYYTIEQADANLDALTINIISMLESLELKYDSIINAEGEYRDTIISRIETKIDSICGEVSNNKTQIQTIKSDLVKLRNDLTAEYRNAIETAIHEYDGKFDSITTARVVAVNKSIVDRLDGRIDSLCVLVSTNRKDIDSIFNSISDLVSKVEVLRTDVDALLATVQSITIIPEYSDGSVSLLKLTPKANKYRFEIYPESVAQQLAEAGTGVFSMKAVYTMTKAVGSSVDMPVTAVSYNNGIIEITADASGISSDVYYSKNGISANARLLISSDNTKIASDYFLLTPTVPGAVDLGLSVWWATEDLCAEEPGMGGPLFQWSKLEPNTTEAFDIPTLADIQGTEYDAATYILGEGWSIPTDEQFQELTQNCTFDRSGRTIIATGPNNKKIMIIYGNAYYWTSNYRYLDRHELMVWSFTYSSSTSKTTYSNTYLQGKTLSELSLHTCRIRPICK